MNTEQEAQQAQTIDNIKRAHRIARLRLSSQGVEPLGISAHLDRGALLKIVDSQAQTIAKQAKEIEKLNEQLASAFEDGYDRFDGRNRSIRKYEDPHGPILGGPGSPGYDSGEAVTAFIRGAHMQREFSRVPNVRSRW